MRNRTIKSLFGLTILSIMVISLFAGLYYSYAKSNLQEKTISTLQEKSLQELYFKSRDYNRFTQQITTTTAFIANSQMLHNFVLQPDRAKIAEINDLFHSIINNFPWYKRISFFDLDGIERFYATPNSNIQNSQNKVNADLFQYAQTLSPGTVGEWGIHVSKMMEQGKVTYDPSLIRIAPIAVTTPEKQSILGYIATDINVGFLSSYFKQGSVKIFNIEVLNHRGDYLASNDPKKLFGKQIPERQAFNFRLNHPETWQFMQENESGCYYGNQALTCFYKKKAPHDRDVFFITYYTKADIANHMAPQLSSLNHTIENIFSFSLLLLIPFVLFRYNVIKHRLESQLARAALNSMAAILLTDNKNRIIHVNDEFEHLTGYKNQDIIGLDPGKSILRNQHFPLNYQLLKKSISEERADTEISFISKNGETLSLIVRSYAILSKRGKPEYFITYLIDNTERKELENQLKLLSEKDGLTKLWNRRRFDQELKAQAILATRYEKQHNATLAILDIDYFKTINDTQGHDAGDRVLKQLADSLTEQLRDSDFIARIGGEEFAIIMNYTSCYEAYLAIERIRVNIEQNKDIPITISIGLTPIDSDNTTMLFKQADQALYKSKASGRNQTQCDCAHNLLQVKRA